MAPARDSGPTAYQEMFVIELRARREMAGLSRNKLAEALGCTPQWIAKVETFEKPPSEGLADDLDTYFECHGTFRRLWEKHIEVRKRGLIPKGFRPLAEAEPDASQLSIFAPLLIPGLLQTEEHARFVFESEQRADKVEEVLTLRMERQRIFARANPPWLFVLLREAVLRDLHACVRVGQCKRLLDMMAEPNVAIQVIPTTARVFQGGGYQLLSFDASADVAYVDGVSGFGQMLTEPPDVRRLNMLFNMIRSTAMSADDSGSFIRSIMESV
ncbi:helix-turn-helix domain-containing protein [Actinomadura fibrosa]|uniref:Helix-turn-helix transcriptional regulator n=1 Tax=Actinomadura fibrosa TaxID=111802 RepID=A0ABW2XAD0_9ACTN|nr:helix-turn-helix transcriptional regulator [Actinomadura fibrosa]